MNNLIKSHQVKSDQINEINNDESNGHKKHEKLETSNNHSEMVDIKLDPITHLDNSPTTPEEKQK